jgi:hypothetical protein
MDTDILKPNTGYISIERPSTTVSSKGTSDLHSSDLGTPDPDAGPDRYTEPVSDGEEDEDMDIVPAKDEGRRMGLTETEVAEAIAYREKMLKQAAEDQILNGKNDQRKDKSDEALEGVIIDIDERTPFLRVRRATANAPDRMRALSIDPLAPSAAFDETLKERLREAKSREGASSIKDTAINDDDDEEAADREEGSSQGAAAAGDEHVFVRHFKAPDGKRVAIPVRIEPKVYFAAERTFLVSCLARNTDQ